MREGKYRIVEEDKKRKEKCRQDETVKENKRIKRMRQIKQKGLKRGREKSMR